MTKTKKKTIILNIIFYLSLALIYGVVVFAIIVKANGGVISIGGTRSDVILTDSMSVKNEHHLDFLEGTTQIQPFDIVVSSNIDDNTELKVKDCVLFKNPDLGNATVCHRIVNINEEGIKFSINNCSKEVFDNKELTSLDPMSGSISVSSLDLGAIQIVAYSSQEYSSYYQLFFGPNEIPLNVQTIKEKDGVYRHLLTYSRSEKVPYSVTVRPSNLGEQYIESIMYTSFAKGDLHYNSSELVVDENNGYKKLFCPYYLYETRGDKSSTADGMFKRESLLTKVNVVIPKLGYFIHFIQSIPGIITFIGLGLILTIASFFWTKDDKKGGKSGENTTELQEETVPKQEDIVEDTNSLDKEDNTPK